MILYHGTNQAFDKIDLKKSRPNKDFGRGFYLSADYKQALRMAQVKVDQLEAGSPTVLTYEISDEKLKTLNIRRFENYSEEWARFILMNRNNPVDVPAHDYDIVIGPIANAKPGSFRELRGDIDRISSVEFVDQNPIGRSSRSNPVTYIKAYDDIRKLFSEQPLAKINGFGHSHFSFNIDGGRCPECLGEGTVKIPMQFMADITMTCESCGGKRFIQDVLEVKYRGMNISDVLDMSVDEAIDFFSSAGEPAATRIASKLMPLHDVGLGYIALGQNSSTLSGGESQRVKLAYFLGIGKDTATKGSSDKPIMFIFDDPTTGLHFDDIEKLLASFRALLDRGHTIIVVEHTPYIIAAADHIIELGPEGGDQGGYLLKQ